MSLFPFPYDLYAKNLYKYKTYKIQWLKKMPSHHVPMSALVSQAVICVYALSHTVQCPVHWAEPWKRKSQSDIDWGVDVVGCRCMLPLVDTDSTQPNRRCPVFVFELRRCDFLLGCALWQQMSWSARVQQVEPGPGLNLRCSISIFGQLGLSPGMSRAHHGSPARCHTGFKSFTSCKLILASFDVSWHKLTVFGPCAILLLLSGVRVCQAQIWPDGLEC